MREAMADHAINAESVLGWVGVPSEGPTATVLVTGDLCPIHRLAEPLANGQIEAVFADTLALMAEADVTVVNLELPLCQSPSPIPKCGPNFRGDPRMAAALAAAGVDVACLANNHIMDQGPAGLAETLAALKSAGIEAVGGGATAAEAAAPLIVTVNDLRLAILNVAEGEFSRSAGGPGAAGLDVATNAAAIAEARRHSDAVLVICHAGSEQVPFPPPSVQRAYRHFIESGAAVVIGHHPHVPQGMELYRGRPIVYSLGNFLFDWPEPEPETDVSYVVQVTLGRGGAVGLRARPISKSANGGVRRMPKAQRPAFIQLLKDLSAPLVDSRCVGRLWEQQCVGLYPSRYVRHLRRVSSLAELPADPLSTEQLAGIGLFNCQTHSEAVATIGRLMVEGRLARREPEAGVIDKLMARMTALGEGQVPMA